MRKVFWCFTATGVLLAGVLASASYYACAHPQTMMGQCINTVAGAAAAMEPVAALATRVARATHQTIDLEETTTTAGSCEECIPEEPRPIAPEPVAEQTPAERFEAPAQVVEKGPAPIVISEDEPIQRVEEAQPPSTIEMKELQVQASPENACPKAMPYCTDDEPLPARTMPYADPSSKQADGSEASEDGGFEEWKKLIEGESKESKPDTAEALPAPAEDVDDESKCQEDCHRHEHYSGCPHMTCPYTGKTYPCDPPVNRTGKEEVSEEPEVQPKKHFRKPHLDRSKENRPHTEGVDTMEYRPSDGGLNEFGPGPF